MNKKYKAPVVLFLVLIFLLSLSLLSLFGNSLEGDKKISDIHNLSPREATLGEKLFFEGQYKEASQLFKIAADKGFIPGRDKALWGISCLRDGRKDEARDILLDAKKEFPLEPLIYVGLGYTAFDDKDYKKSLDYFSKAEKLYPRMPEAVKGMVAVYINQGVQEYAKGNIEKAESLFRKALGVNPESSEAYTNIAILKQEEGNLEEAVSLYKKALSFKAGDIKIMKLLVQALKEKEGLGGSEFFSAVVKLVQADSFDPYPFELLGRIYESDGKRDKSIKAFEAAYERGSEDPYVYLCLSKQRYNEGSSKEAVSMLYLTVGKAVHRIGLIQAGAAKKVNDMKGSLKKEDIQELKKYSELLSEPKDILNSAISMLRRVRASDTLFEEDIKKLTSWYPHSADIKAAYGRLLESGGKWAEALAIWKDMAEKHPYDYSVHINLSRIYNRLGNMDLALFECRKAIDIDSKKSDGYNLLFKLYLSVEDLDGLISFLVDRYDMDSYNETLVSMMIKSYELAGNKEKVSRMKAWLEHLEEYKKE